LMESGLSLGRRSSTCGFDSLIQIPRQNVQNSKERREKVVINSKLNAKSSTSTQTRNAPRSNKRERKLWKRSRLNGTLWMVN
jgi:hypothetical protein